MSADTQLEPSYRPDLPDWGAYLRWPMEGVEWVHPDDLQIAQEMIPSQRVFRRSRWDGEYYWLQYGQTRIRVKPSMWFRVPDVDLEVGQQVELLARQGKNDPGIFRIADIFWDRSRRRVEYTLRRDALELEKRFARADIRPISVKHHLRVGFYHHQPQRDAAPPDLERLDPGDISG